MLVQNSEDPNVIGRGLHVMFYIVAAFTTTILVLILLCACNNHKLKIENSSKRCFTAKRDRVDKNNDQIFLSVFKSEPPIPPSPAQAVQREAESTGSFFVSVKKLVTNTGYLLLLLSYGINVGVFYAISTLLNHIVLQYFPVSLSASFLYLLRPLILIFCLIKKQISPLILSLYFYLFSALIFHIF